MMPPNATSQPMTKLRKAQSDYHKSQPEIPAGLVPLNEWAKAHGITANCAAKWVWMGRLQVYKVPGYGRRSFIKPADGEKVLRPIASVPPLAR